MKLTANESKLIERLRKRDRQWRFTRWVVLIGGMALIAIWAWMLHYVLKSASATRDKELQVLIQALAFPKVLFVMFTAALMIGVALRDWHGSATRTLLLKLLEEYQGAPDSAPNCGPATTASSGAVKGPQSVT